MPNYQRGLPITREYTHSNGDRKHEIAISFSIQTFANMYRIQIMGSVCNIFLFDKLSLHYLVLKIIHSE